MGPTVVGDGGRGGHECLTEELTAVDLAIPLGGGVAEEEIVPGRLDGQQFDEIVDVHGGPAAQNSMTSRPRVPPASNRRWASAARSAG